MEKFNPLDYKRPAQNGPYRFQVRHFQLDHETGIKAREVANRTGMSNQKFVEACVKFALANMDGEHNVVR